MPSKPIMTIRFEEPGKLVLLAFCVTTILAGVLVLLFSPDWLKEAMALFQNYHRFVREHPVDPDTAATRAGLFLIALSGCILLYSIFFVKQPPRYLFLHDDHIVLSYIFYSRSIQFIRIRKVIITPYSLEVLYSRSSRSASDKSIHGHTMDLIGLNLRPIAGLFRSKGVAVELRDR